MSAATPEQIQQLLDGLATQPDLLETFKKALGLEKKKEVFHPKTYSRLEKFSGEDSQWQEWVFNLIMTTKKVSKEVGEAMERIILECGTKLEMTIVKGIVKDDGIMNKYGAEMFAILCELTGGEANAVVRGVNNKGLGHCGFCAFYALNHRFNPKTPARTLQFLHLVVNPPKVKDVRLLPKAIEDWEARRAKLGTEFGETLSDNMSTAIFTSMLPLDLQEMVFQSQGAEAVKYDIIRDKVVTVASRRIQMSQPTPMDIGEVNGEQYGPENYWGYGKGQELENGEGEIDLVKGQGKGTQCYRCSGYGHMARDCATEKGQPKGQGKGDYGKGKGDYGKGKGDYGKGEKGKGKGTDRV